MTTQLKTNTAYQEYSEKCHTPHEKKCFKNAMTIILGIFCDQVWKTIIFKIKENWLKKVCEGF